MLVLSRKQNERIVIGDCVIIQVVRIRGNRVRLGIDAPASVPVQRLERAAEPAAIQDHDDRFESAVAKLV